MICQATSSFSLMPKGGSTTSSVSVGQEVWDQLVRLHSWWGRWRFSSILWGRTEILNAKELVHVWSCNVQCLFLKSPVATSKFCEVPFICPLYVYGPILLAGGVNMRLRCIKKNVRYKCILGNLTTYVRKTHLPTFTMNEGNHREKSSTCCEVHFLCNIRVLMYLGWQGP